MQSANKRIALLLTLGLIGLLLLAPVLWLEAVPERSYSQVVQDVADGKVERAVFSPGSAALTYAGEEQPVRVRFAGSEAPLREHMVKSGVQVEYAQGGGVPTWTTLISWLFPLALVGTLLWLMMSRSGGSANQALSVGESRARLVPPGEKKVTMQDVAGMAEVKEELAEVIDFLRSADRYQELGARIPKGILLSGPPGTGKTLLARAVAGEAAVPFFSISGSDFVEIFAGVGAARVRDLFTKARGHSPCIIFVDEIDAVGRQRGMSIGGGNDEREQTLNQLLTEMDGFSPSDGIIVMAATNRPDILDTAILRPGRFDRQIAVDPPDRAGRLEILQVHARNKPLADDVVLDDVARLTTAFTGADLANLLNEAALLAARTRHEKITRADLTAAYERVVTGGPASRKVMAAEERVRVAFHEAGHAIVSRQLTHADPIEKISIVPRGRALGYVMYRPGEDKSLHSRSEIIDRIVSLLGGRAAEEVLLGDISTGASDDLERASTMARRMVTELGMDPTLGPVSMRTESHALYGQTAGRTVSERTATAVDEAVKQVVTTAYTRAIALVSEHREALTRLAETLLDRETVDGRDLDQVLAGQKNLPRPLDGVVPCPYNSV